MVLIPQLILCLALVFSIVGDALADPKHGKQTRSRPSHGISDTTAAISTAVALISGSDRDILRSYLRNNYRSNCPPGLAKKNNGCLPPGIAKKYTIGKPLGVGFSSLPGNLLGRLHPPHGYRFVRVDQDILLMAEATKKVVDAVTLLSAVR
jgi:hypothetical protein